MVLATIRDHTSPHYWHQHVLMFALKHNDLRHQPQFQLKGNTGDGDSLMITPHLIVDFVTN